MKAYDYLASYYDIVFDWEERLRREEPFFETLFQEKMATSILDLGCGAGGHSLFWSDLGMHVVGLDSSAGMIREAQRRADEEGLDVEFHCLSITDFSQKVQQRFDAVVCVGNTLPHLIEPEAVRRLFRETIASMKPTGVAIFHCINYHRILEVKKRDHPVLSKVVDDKEYVLCRFYDFLPHALEFNTVMLIKDQEGWHSHSSQVLHYPWMKDDLETLAKEAGFSHVMFYGGLDFSPFNPDESKDLYMVCEVGDDRFEPEESSENA